MRPLYSSANTYMDKSLTLCSNGDRIKLQNISLTNSKICQHYKTNDHVMVISFVVLIDFRI